MEAEENEIDHFYEQLQNVMEVFRKHDMLILCGNMNPAVGASNLNRLGIMGAHETGNISDNDGKLIEFCEMNSFVITVTIFPHKEMLKTKKMMNIPLWQISQSDWSFSHWQVLQEVCLILWYQGCVGCIWLPMISILCEPL